MSRQQDHERPVWRLQYQSSWRLTLLVICFLPILLGLGSWQWRKSVEKADFEAHIEAQRQQPAVALADVSADRTRLDLLPVHIEGTLLTERRVWRDNRTYRGRAGYELLVPVRVEGVATDAVLVNFGWYAAELTRDRLPAVNLPRRPVRIEGMLAHVQPTPAVFGEVVEAINGDLRVQRVDLAELSEALDLELFPRILIADSGQPGVQTRMFQPLRVSAARHRGYALQWFGLALVLVLGWCAACFRLSPVSPATKGHDND